MAGRPRWDAALSRDSFLSALVDIRSFLYSPRCHLRRNYGDGSPLKNIGKLL